MAKKKNKMGDKDKFWVTAGAAVPISLKEAFNKRVDRVGLVKERAFAAAMQAILDADDTQILRWAQKVTANYITPASVQVEESGRQLGGREAALDAGLQSDLEGHRNTELSGSEQRELHKGDNRKVAHG